MENNNFYNLTDEDVETLRLLDLQLYGNLVFIVSDVLSYISTIESIDLVLVNMRIHQKTCQTQMCLL